MNGSGPGAWDELTDVHLEGEGWETDATTAIQRKRPDAWAVHWGKRNLFILEFTRPNDRCATALQDTDAYKRDRRSYPARGPRPAASLFGIRSGSVGPARIPRIPSHYLSPVGGRGSLSASGALSSTYASIYVRAARSGPSLRSPTFGCDHLKGGRALPPGHYLSPAGDVAPLGERCALLDLRVDLRARGPVGPAATSADARRRNSWSAASSGKRPGAFRIIGHYTMIIDTI